MEKRKGLLAYALTALFFVFGNCASGGEKVVVGLEPFQEAGGGPKAPGVVLVDVDLGILWQTTLVGDPRAYVFSTWPARDNTQRIALSEWDAEEWSEVALSRESGLEVARGRRTGPAPTRQTRVPWTDRYVAAHSYGRFYQRGRGYSASWVSALSPSRFWRTVRLPGVGVRDFRYSEFRGGLMGVAYEIDGAFPFDAPRSEFRVWEVARDGSVSHTALPWPVSGATISLIHEFDTAASSSGKAWLFAGPFGGWAVECKEGAEIADWPVLQQVTSRWVVDVKTGPDGWLYVLDQDGLERVDPLTLAPDWRTPLPVPNYLYAPELLIYGGKAILMYTGAVGSEVRNGVVAIDLRFGGVVGDVSLPSIPRCLGRGPF